MNECWNFFKYAVIEDLESIKLLIKNNYKWFSNINENTFYKKIYKKECIYENGVLLTFKILQKKKLANFEIQPNNTILEQMVRENLDRKSSYAEHIFTKFVNCTLGNTYLSVHANNRRAIKFYKKMGMLVKADYISNLDNKKIIILVYNKNRFLNLQ